MTTTPTWEQIAEILQKALGWHVPTTSIDAAADALLARLRPAWERMERGETHTYRGTAVSCEEYESLRGQAIAERDALRADLRACAEALEHYGSHLTGCLANEAIARKLFGDKRVEEKGIGGPFTGQHPDCTCGYSAALARPGVQEAGK